MLAMSALTLRSLPLCVLCVEPNFSEVKQYSLKLLPKFRKLLLELFHFGA